MGTMLDKEEKKTQTPKKTRLCCINFVIDRVAGWHIGMSSASGSEGLRFKPQ